MPETKGPHGGRPKATNRRYMAHLGRIWSSWWYDVIPFLASANGLCVYMTRHTQKTQRALRNACSMQTGAKIALVLACECHFSTERQETAVKPKPPIAWRARARAAHHTQPTHRTFARFTPALHRALRRMAGLVFLLVFWVLAGACQRHGVGAFLLCNSSSSSGFYC